MEGEPFLIAVFAPQRCRALAEGVESQRCKGREVSMHGRGGRGKGEQELMIMSEKNYNVVTFKFD